MLNRIIDATLGYRWLILIAIMGLLGVGGYALYTIPVEAFPDLTNNQVVVVTEAAGLPPTEMEQLVTYPIERAMLGLPNKEEVRSLSKLGLSMVTIVFTDEVPMYLGRQLVAERIQQISTQLPQGVQPQLGLPATAFGELFQYTLSGPMNALELKDLQEWVIKGQIRTIPGVSEINTWGGQTKQFQLVVDPVLLTQYGLTLHDVALRVEENNTNFGGGYIEHAAEQYTLLGLGRAVSPEDFGNIVLTSTRGTPVLLKDIAEVRIGPAPPSGATVRNGAETVSGTVIMLKGENGKQLIERVKAKIAGLRLPSGVTLIPFYDQAFVIDGTIDTVKTNLFEGFILVTVVLLLFLGNLRAAIITALVIPFSIVIIIAVYLPILFLQGLEGRMFRPMAITVCAALFGSLLLALTLMPALSSFAFRHGIQRTDRERGTRAFMARLTDRYGRALTSAIEQRWITVTAAAIVLVVTFGSLVFIGTEFMPRLDEGSILLETRKLPGISLTESIEISKVIEQRLRAFPEIADVVVKIGRPDFATEAMGINEGDTYLILKPKIEWTRFHTKEELIEAVDKALAAIPGISYNFSQPMEMRMDETVSGVKADLAIKIFGDDFGTLDTLGQQVLRSMSSVRGAADAQMLVTSGVAELTVKVDRAALARYGLNVTDVEEAVSAGGSGDVISTVIDAQKRYTVALHLPAKFRSDPDAMRAIQLKAPAGEQVALDQVAHLEVTRGPEKVEREDGQRRIVVMSNVRGRDLGSFVDEVRSKIEKDVTLPPGYFIAYGGQFENQERATRRLMIVVPAVIAVIFVLLYLTFGTIKPALLAVGNVPFAVVGGVAALWIRDMNLNLSASVGFIGLFGVAMLNGVVLISSINQLREAGESTRQAVLAGSRRRLRPVLMAAFVASFGFIPMAVATSTGAEVQRPLASVVIGGLVSSTVLTLFLLPVLYDWVFRGRHEPEVEL